MPPDPSISLFATTRWSVVLAAGAASSPQAREALERLCQAYWYPLYAYVRHRGRSAHDAQDLTQEFFLQLLQHGYLSRADPRKGRFRAFLLVALNHFLTNDWHRARALKRGGGQALLSWDEIKAEERYRADPLAMENPEQLFEQRWALAVVERAVRRLQDECVSSGRAEAFDKLKGLLTGQHDTEPYAALAVQLGTTEPGIKMTVLRLRRRFGDILREEVAHTVSRAEDVDDELRHLLRVLAQRS
jgi:RNA polymerase sigma-70 factor (ECF subfamily)